MIEPQPFLVSRRSPRLHRAQGPKRWWQRTWFRALVLLVLLALIALFAAVEYTLRNAAPILRKRIIQTLSQRFNAPVELDTLDISLLKGVEVSGSGLRIPYGGPTNPAAPGPAPVLLRVDHFSFRSTVKNLLHSPTHISTVYVDGLVLDLPAGIARGSILGPNQHAIPADPTQHNLQPKVTLIADHIQASNAKLIIENRDPKKNPKEFDITQLALNSVGAGLPMTYDAQLTNPIPKGDIHAAGHFGPWDTDDPRSSALDGDYTFAHADLNTIRGLGGILHSTGHFSGVLDHITVDGVTDTPDFSLDISNHPMPLHTKFHAFVDGTTGDTTLDPVAAQLGHSDLLCRGTVMNLRGKGHDIALDVTMQHGRIDDILELGVKAPEPMMRGGLAMRAHLHVPPGKVRVAAKLELAGKVHIEEVRFTNPKVQDKITEMSQRAQGKHHEKHLDEAGLPPLPEDQTAPVRSDIVADFTLSHGQALFQSVQYRIPGATVLLDGAYSLDGDRFEFKGHVRTEATASQMVGGWKGWLLKPVDPFFKKNGAGLEAPISINGQGKDVHFGLAFKTADETPQQMQQDLATEKKEGADKPPRHKRQKHDRQDVP